MFHQYVVQTAHRDALRARLALDGVASAVHYPVPIHRSEAYAALGLGPGSLPVVEHLAQRICSLPIFPGMTPEESERAPRPSRSLSPTRRCSPPPADDVKVHGVSLFQVMVCGRGAA